ncbi:MAG TPA: MFS transporter [Bacillales bacterium]
MGKLREKVVHPFYFWLILIVSFLTIWGYGAQRVIAPIQMETMGTGILMIGVFLSLFGLPRAVMDIVGGHLADHFSKKNNIILSLLLSGVISIFFIGISQTSLAIGLWRVVMGVGLSWSQTAILAYLAELTAPSIRGTAFGVQKMATWLGIALAGLAAPFFLHFISLTALMLGLALLSLLGIALIAFFLHDVDRDAVSSPVAEKKPVSLHSRPNVNFFKKIVLSLNGCITKVVEDGLVTFFLPIYILSQYDNLIATGLVISIFTVIYVISQPLGGILADRIGSWPVIGIGLLFILIAVLLLSFSNELSYLYVFSVIAGLGSGITATSAEMRASLIGSAQRRSRTLGHWRFFRDMGSVFGPLLIGALWGIGDEEFIPYVVAFLILVSMLLTFWVIYDDQRNGSTRRMRAKK